jgi:hypothetical protein
MLENLYPNENNGHMADVHDNVMSQNGGSVWVLDSLNENRIFSGRLTYDKGAAIIHSMRYMLNDDTQFFQVLKDFQNQYANSTAYGVNFKESLELASGLDFTSFFEEWYFGEGYPTYSLLWEQIGDDLIIEVNHTTSKPNVTALFTNDLDIKFSRPGQSDTTIRFQIDNNSNTFNLSNIGTISSSISIDPENWIINKIGSIIESDALDLDENTLPITDQLRLSPNPSDGTFTIANLKESAKIRVYDLNGKTRREVQVQPNQLIDIKDLGSGYYIIEIQVDNITKRLRLISF